MRARALPLVVAVFLLVTGEALAAATGTGSTARSARHRPTHRHRHGARPGRAPHRSTPVASGSASGTPRVRTIPVTFTVLNINSTAVSCLPIIPDGKTYTVSGSLVLPAGAPPSGVTLYAHGLGYAGYFWDFTSVPGYDYAAAEAADGHASVVIDRVGYGSSSIPAGNATCVGSQATMLHEIVQDLRAGTYTTADGGAAPVFSRVGLVGHSVGGELAEIEAYSFRDVDALGVMEWADQFYSLRAYAAFAADAEQCARGSTTQVGTSAPDYATFGQTDAEYDALMFADIAPDVAAALNRLRTNDPCGVVDTVLGGTAADLGSVESITVPVAYVHAGADGIFQAGLPWPQAQEALYRDSAKVTDIDLPGEGHAVTLERRAPALEAAMSAWLTANGL